MEQFRLGIVACGSNCELSARPKPMDDNAVDSKHPDGNFETGTTGDPAAILVKYEMYTWPTGECGPAKNNDTNYYIYALSCEYYAWQRDWFRAKSQSHRLLHGLFFFIFLFCRFFVDEDETTETLFDDKHDEGNLILTCV